MTNKTIEFICSANLERSPFAECVARDIIQLAGADYQVTSSGIYVNKASTSPERLVRYAIDKDVFSPEELEKINYFLGKASLENLWPFFDKAKAEFEERGVNNRAYALNHFGVKSQAKKTRDQTVVRPDTSLIIALDQKVYEGVNSLYRESNTHPKIEMFEIPNTFGESRERYMSAATQIKLNVEERLGRIIQGVVE